MASYNFQQQVYSLSQTANISFNKRFPTLNVLQDYVSNTMKGLLQEAQAVELIGSWGTIWGPYTWCHYASKESGKTASEKTPYYSDNTMFLAYQEETNTYVLSVAGTNAISWYGWVVEDFSTVRTEPWSKLVPDTTATDAKISEGTYTGIDILLNKMTTQYDSGGAEIIDFLKTHLANATPGATLAVTGHSLGGALSPTMATYLKETQDNWDPNGIITAISTYPTAGPTPGNKNFAQHIESELSNHYHAAYNQIDMIPHAWQLSMMMKIPALYVPCGIAQPKFIKEAVDLLMALTGLNDYQQAQPLTPLNGTCYTTDAQLVQQIAGALDPTVVKEMEKYGLTDLDNLIAFLLEVAYQHTTAYNSLLDREAFSALFDMATGHTPGYTHLVLEAIDEILKVFKLGKQD